MFRIHIKSKKKSQRHKGYQGGYGPDYQDEYGYGPDEYTGNEQYEQYDQEAGTDQDTCYICGDTITNGHLAFVINSREYEIHTSCLVTGIALITNGITLLIGFLKQKWGGAKPNKEYRIESEE